MAKQTINVGSSANDGTGDKIRVAFQKTNANFTELYDTKLDSVVAGDNITIDNTDPLNPVINSTVGGSGTLQEVTDNGNATTNSITVQGVTISGDVADFVTNIGNDAGESSIGIVVSNLGYKAGENNTGDFVTNIGGRAGENNTGLAVTNIGVQTGQNNAGDNVTNIGNGSGQNNTLNNVINLGVDAQATDTNQLALNTGIANTVINLPATATELTLRDSASVESIAYLSDITGGGGVTSVGLTMPSAFSVTNSPITSSGDIAVTGTGTVSQYIRGDGTLANFPNSTGGGASVSYYLNGSVNQGTFGGDTYYQMSKTPILGTGTNFTRTNGAGNGYIASFITDAGDPSFLNIPGGNWNLEFYFQSSASGGSPQFYGEVYKVSATNVFTLVASGSANPEGIIQGTVIDQYFTSIPVPQTSLLITDRLAVRIYVITGGRTITLHTENGNLCQVITTFTTGLTALNGLTQQVQNFATGTSGTDYNISSLTDTHTFNLPVASASNTGKLSSTDWSTFNTAFTDRFKWDGGSSGLVAATGRTSLGASTVGSNLFTLTNPSAITFIRINADNSISTLDASTFRTAIGAGTSSTNGTVTSVAELTLGTTGTDLSSSVATGTTTPVITLNVPDASATARGVITTGAQTIAGAKTLSTAPILSSLTASQLLALDASKNIQTLSTATYPSLTELSYGKGVTSAIQTQLDNRIRYVVEDYTVSSSVTGTTAETITNSYTITAGSFSSRKNPKFYLKFRKTTGTANTSTVRLYVSNTNNFATSSLAGTSLFTATVRNARFERVATYFDGTSLILNAGAATSAVTDNTTFTGNPVAISLDPSQIIYVWVTLQNVDLTDATVIQFVQITT